MKTSIQLLLSLLLLVSFQAFGQKLKDDRIKVKYVQLPVEKLPADFKTYSVSVHGYALSQAGMNSVTAANSIKMDGFKRLDGTANNYGHIRVSVNTGYATNGRGDFKSRVSVSKDKNGKETRTTYYWYEFPFSGTSSFQIVDPEGKILATGEYPTNSTLSGQESTSSSTVTNSYNATQDALKKQFAGTLADNALTGARMTLRKRFDFAYSEDHPELYYIKNHDTEDAFKANLEKAREVFEAQAPDAPAAETLEKLASAIAFWEEQGATDPAADKKMKNIYEAAHFNLAVVFFYLDDLAKAEKHANLVLLSEEKDRKTTNLLERIAATQKLMLAQGINTLHYKRDLSNAVPPAKVKELEKVKDEISAENNAVEAEATVKGEVIRGSVVQAKDAEELIFGKNGNTKFMVESGGELKEYDLNADDVTAFSFGGRKFVKAKFSACAKGKSEPALSILEEVYVSERIKLYKYYPSTGVMGDAKTEFAYQKKGEEMPVSLLDTQFLLWNKGLGNYFSDCADLKDMCTGGGIQLNKDDLIKGARIYSELCK